MDERTTATTTKIAATTTTTLTTTTTTTQAMTTATTTIERTTEGDGHADQGSGRQQPGFRPEPKIVYIWGPNGPV